MKRPTPTTDAARRAEVSLLGYTSEYTLGYLSSMKHAIERSTHYDPEREATLQWIEDFTAYIVHGLLTQESTNEFW